MPYTPDSRNTVSEPCSGFPPECVLTCQWRDICAVPYLGQQVFEELVAVSDVTHRPRSAPLTRLSSDSLIGVGKNWVSDVADKSMNVLVISLERFETTVSSMRRGMRNSSMDRACCGCFDAMLRSLWLENMIENPSRSCPHSRGWCGMIVGDAPRRGMEEDDEGVSWQTLALGSLFKKKKIGR